MPDEESGSEQDAFIRAVGSRVREIRQMRGLTQSQLAAKAELRQPYVFEIESSGSNLTLRVLERLARALEVSPRDLFPLTQSVTVSESDLSRVRTICDGIEALLQELREFAGEGRPVK